MTKVYPSKIGLELVLPISIVLGSVLVLFMTEEPRWLGPMLILPLVAFIVHMFLTTRYIIEEQTLIIRSGFVYRLKIDIHTIKSIRNSKDLWSSPAASIDRLKIAYGKGQMVLISPKQKTQFIQDLQAINPNIEVK